MKIKFIHIITAIGLIFNFSCQEEEFEFGAINAANINISYEIIGIEADNPDGFGTRKDLVNPITKTDYDLLSEPKKLNTSLLETVLD